MLLIHLSDLHFKKGITGTQMDPYAFIRQEIVNDIESQCNTIGSYPDAIIISGDIAYAGQKDEYSFAIDWLDKLCEKIHVNPSCVFTVPGNHDVDRQTTRGMVIRAIQKKLNDSSFDKVEDELRDHLLDNDAGPLLYKPIEQYNEFATRFFCSIYPPEETLAQKILRFRDGSILQISGLNSTVISNDEDREGSLLIDPAYRQLIREPGVVHLTVCHHPIEWLKGRHAFQDAISDVARIHLFGHEHTNRIMLEPEWIRIAASAALPDRSEQNWEPGYNLLELEIGNTENKRVLEAKIHVRIWQNRPGQFIAKRTRSGDDAFSHQITLPHWSPPSQNCVPTEQEPAVVTPALRPQDINEISPMDSLREVSIRFFKLNLSQKLTVLGKLELIEDSDVNMPDFMRFSRALIRAQECGKMDALDSETQRILRTTPK